MWTENHPNILSCNPDNLLCKPHKQPILIPLTTKTKLLPQTVAKYTVSQSIAVQLNIARVELPICIQNICKINRVYNATLPLSSARREKFCGYNATQSISKRLRLGWLYTTQQSTTQHIGRGTVVYPKIYRNRSINSRTVGFMCILNEY